MVRKRVGWRRLLFVAEAYTGSVLSAFEDELQAAIALTFFIPLLIGTGDNTGTQITTTLTRPAVISGPFITTLVDGTGLIIYFEIARSVLHL